MKHTEDCKLWVEGMCELDGSKSCTLKQGCKLFTPKKTKEHKSRRNAGRNYGMTTKGSGIVRGIGYLINMGYRFDGGVAALPDGSKCDICGSVKDLMFALPEKTSRLPQLGVVLCKTCLDKIVYDQILEMAYLYCQVCKEQTAHEPWDNGYYVCHECKTQTIARWRP